MPVRCTGNIKIITRNMYHDLLKISNAIWIRNFFVKMIEDNLKMIIPCGVASLGKK